MIADFYKISAGIGYGPERLVAFDNALIDSGVGNYNLVRLSSILPCGATPKNEIALPLGSMLPIAYASYSTNKPDTPIAAAVAIGWPKQLDNEHCAVIMEYEGECTTSEVLKIVESMVESAFKARGWELYKIKSKASEASSRAGEWVSVFACVAEWSENND